MLQLKFEALPKFPVWGSSTALYYKTRLWWIRIQNLIWHSF